MRVTVKKLLTYAAAAISLLFLFIKLRSLRHSDTVKVLDAKCRVPADVTERLFRLMADTHRILDNLKLSHFLCYGTLWGVLKTESLLPWEDNVEICALNEELSALDESYLMRMFRKSRLSLQYDSKDGVYEVSELDPVGDHQPELLRIFVFERDNNLDMMKRVGWSRRVLPQDCETALLQCFPPRLLEQPLPVAVINDVRYRIPREEIEIQKYMYPDTWWKDVKPQEC